MSFRAPPVAISVDRTDPKRAVVSFGQGPPELVDFHDLKSRPLPTIALGAGLMQLQWICHRCSKFLDSQHAHS